MSIQFARQLQVGDEFGHALFQGPRLAEFEERYLCTVLQGVADMRFKARLVDDGLGEQRRCVQIVVTGFQRKSGDRRADGRREQRALHGELYPGRRRGDAGYGFPGRPIAQTPGHWLRCCAGCP